MLGKLVSLIMLNDIHVHVYVYVYVYVYVFVYVYVYVYVYVSIYNIVSMFEPNYLESIIAFVDTLIELL